jgi:hypothetical protein
MAADGFAMGYVFLRKFFGGGQGQGLPFGYRLADAHCVLDSVHRVDRINGSRASRREGAIYNLQVARKPCKVISTKSARALGQTVGGGGANGASAAHYHVRDGAGSFAKVSGGHDFKLMGQKALFDEEDGVLRGVEGNGSEMAGFSAQGDVHQTG